jgi:leucyl/phenylalanyl-tRNA--protein transferase
MTNQGKKKLFWLDDHDIHFPDIELALETPNGLLAAGGDLTEARLLRAYRHGIFPWFEVDQPIFWWSPYPLCLFDPATFTPRLCLKKRLRKKDYVVKVDQQFPEVIDACRFRGPDQDTWITDEMRQAYCALFDAGYAHSIECYMNDELVGGLYGISLGNLFFGESMFHHVTDASKIAFAHLMQLMASVGCPLVDCQIPNPHLESLGTVEISRREFKRLLERHVDAKPIDWPALVKMSL